MVSCLEQSCLLNYQPAPVSLLTLKTFPCKVLSGVKYYLLEKEPLDNCSLDQDLKTLYLCLFHFLILTCIGIWSTNMKVP